MKRAFRTFCATVLLAWFWVPGATAGKAQTIKLTISGGELVSPIEITDPRALELSNVFSGQFLDGSRSPQNEEPKGLPAYEVSFYEKLEENDIRKMYVVYYYPNSSKEQGFLYLPSEGPVHALNVGTIIREARDGKWSYASPEWEALIKSAFLNALEAQKPGSEAEAGEQKNREFARASEVSVDGWTKPQPGWLYVLDPRSEADHPGSRVWLLDPVTGKVKGSVLAGYDPDIALSSDGSRLYVASGERESGELAVIETASGTVHHIAFPERILYKPWYAGLPPYSRMEVSADGGAVRILVNHYFSPEKMGFQLWTFDTESQHFLHTHIHLGNCGYGEFAPSSTADKVNFICPTTNELRFVQLGAENEEVSNTFVKFPWPRKCGVAQALLSSDSNKLSIVRGDGAVYELDITAQKFSPGAESSECGKRLVYPFQWPRSSDGAKVYLGYGPAAANGMATSTELRVFDTVTWRQVGGVRASARFWSATLSKDGKFIYAVVPEQHSVLVIDAASLEERRTIEVGQTPALALVAP